MSEYRQGHRSNQCFTECRSLCTWYLFVCLRARSDSPCPVLTGQHIIPRDNPRGLRSTESCTRAAGPWGGFRPGAAPGRGPSRLPLGCARCCEAGPGGAATLRAPRGAGRRRATANRCRGRCLPPPGTPAPLRSPAPPRRGLRAATPLHSAARLRYRAPAAAAAASRGAAAPPLLSPHPSPPRRA